ncbi:MAG: RNA polymerase sigma factor [Oscillospiraceae bacterium]
MTDEKNQVIEKYIDMIYRLAFANVRNKTDAEDVAHDVVLKYIKLSPVFQSEEHCKNWFLRTTINQCNDLHKSAWKRCVSFFNEDIDSKVCTYPNSDTNADIHSALMKLPQNYRSIIHLFYYENMSVDMISSLLGLKESAVKMRLKRGREKLKKLLEGGDNYFEF